MCAALIICHNNVYLFCVFQFPMLSNQGRLLYIVGGFFVIFVPELYFEVSKVNKAGIPAGFFVSSVRVN